MQWCGASRRQCAGDGPRDVISILVSFVTIGLSVFFATFVASSISAEEFTGDIYACITLDSLKEMDRARAKQDELTMRYLLARESCVVPSLGAPVTILESNWWGAG